MQSVDISRRRLFKGLLKDPVLRPPGALIEPEFISRCTSCGDCGRACPEGIISHDKQGRPQLDFAQGGCTFCEECVRACETQALIEHAGRLPAKAVVGEKCLNQQAIHCRSCEEYCEHGALRFRPGLRGTGTIAVNTDTCTGCGACVSVCPTQAIHIQFLESPYE